MPRVGPSRSLPTRTSATCGGPSVWSNWPMPWPSVPVPHGLKPVAAARCAKPLSACSRTTTWPPTRGSKGLLRRPRVAGTRCLWSAPCTRRRQPTGRIDASPKAWDRWGTLRVTACGSLPPAPSHRSGSPWACWHNRAGRGTQTPWGNAPGASRSPAARRPVSRGSTVSTPSTPRGTVVLRRAWSASAIGKPRSLTSWPRHARQGWIA